MRKSRILLNVIALLLMALLGWYARGAFDGFVGERRSDAPPAGGALRSSGGRQHQSLPPSVPRGGAANSGAVSGREPLAGSPPYAASVESVPPPGAPHPADTSSTGMLPPNVKPGDVKVSPDGMTRLLVRVPPDTVQLQASPPAVLPPDMRPADVEVSPDGTTRLLVRPRLPAPQSQSHPAAVPPELLYRTGAYSPDGTILEKLPPGGKAPAAPPVSKKLKL